MLANTGPSAYLETPEDRQDLHTGDELVSEEREILACFQWLAVAVVLLLSVEPGQQEVLPGPDDEAVHVQGVQVHHDGIPGSDTALRWSQSHCYWDFW